ncbi:MAG TPA: hypothetical protein PLA90_07660 [Candidatus Sumerlaeota bacterium]|nr:hypothetical protein [Candidatus Sumerlaeota bacterium]HPS01403.1 hypothetical protein [Candidatus Sumerlaeota bacterium]
MPHFVMGQLLCVWTLWGFLLAARRPASRWAPLVFCGLGGWGLGWVHSFDLFSFLMMGFLF